MRSKKPHCAFCGEVAANDDDWCMFIKPHSHRVDRMKRLDRWKQLRALGYLACPSCAERFYREELWKNKQPKLLVIDNLAEEEPAP